MARDIELEAGKSIYSLAGKRIVSVEIFKERGGAEKAKFVLTNGGVMVVSLLHLFDERGMWFTQEKINK